MIVVVVVVVIAVIAVFDGGFSDQGVSCYIWGYSVGFALVPSGSDPLRHVVVIKLSNCIKSSRLRGEFHGQS